MPLPDVVVVGAGIVGAACAREFALAGLRVTICDSGPIGAGATGAGMGHLAVMDDSEAQFALTSYSQRLWRDIAAELPAEAEYMDCGSLWVAADAEEMDEVHRKRRFYEERAIPVDVLDARQLSDAEPNLRRGLAGGLLMRNDAVCYPPCAARHFIERSGAKFLLGAKVVSGDDRGVVLEDGADIKAGAVVLATGSAITELFPELPVAPRKGHLLITDRYPGFLKHQLIELGYLKSAHSSSADSVAFNAQPRRTGQILIGSSRQFGVTDTAVESAMLRNMLQRAIEYIPALESLSSIRAWTGFRAATPDKLPLIGRAFGLRNVYLATGHEGLGISTSLATARLLADEILGRESAIPRAPYHPGRKWC
ncbi:MAG TPA: FAD-binding oxidoreductase [Bryobacteraceae bacterium]|nr:FAD-binding oxidoreductase [Bryobacteraceae bacterium]